MLMWFATTLASELPCLLIIRDSEKRLTARATSCITPTLICISSRNKEFMPLIRSLLTSCLCSSYSTNGRLCERHNTIWHKEHNVRAHKLTDGQVSLQPRPTSREQTIKLIRTRGQSNLTKCASRGAHSPVRGHPRGSKFVPLNS